MVLLRMQGITFEQIKTLIEGSYGSRENVLISLITYFGFPDKLHEFDASTLARIVNLVVWYFDALCERIDHPYLKHEYICSLRASDCERVFEMRGDVIVAVNMFREVRIDHVDFDDDYVLDWDRLDDSFGVSDVRDDRAHMAQRIEAFARDVARVAQA